MMDEAEKRAVLDVTWVHAFEQDTPAGSVFVRAGADIPLSRRPRLRFVLHADGSASVAAGGADDRPVAHPGRWSEDDGTVVVRTADGREAFRIVTAADDRLIVQMDPA
jgi:hypothetical protein